MPVVLGPGWSGVLWHEAVGHGLEGDFHRKKTSVFTRMMGDMIASPGVTVVDDGTLADRRGSLTIDDEGTPTQRNVLIENGRLVGLMQDRQNARLMGVKPTGNGRRQSHAYAPMPRMTNTIMLGGDKDPQEIIGSVKKGLYCANFGGGQVDIVSGKFVFTITEGYLIEDGKLGAPVKGATLIGAGSEALTKVGMVGNDMALDPGIGTCGKDGQGVPVGVGQPTLRIDALTVGGTATGYAPSVSLGRRLGVVGVAHRFEPARRLALVVGLRHGEMDHHRVGRRAVPMARVRRDDDRVARLDLLHRLAFELVAADARQHVEDLADRVLVPVGAPARHERHARRAQPRRLLGREHRIRQHRTDEIGRLRLGCRAGGGTHDPGLHGVSSMVVAFHRS